MEPVSLGRVVPHDTSPSCAINICCVKFRSPFRPMFETFIQQLASVRSFLYPQRLIEKREEKVAMAIQIDGRANLAILSLRRSYAALFPGHLAAGGLRHETESCSFALGVGNRIRPRDSFAQLAAASWRASRRAT